MCWLICQVTAYRMLWHTEVRHAFRSAKPHMCISLVLIFSVVEFASILRYGHCLSSWALGQDMWGLFHWEGLRSLHVNPKQCMCLFPDVRYLEHVKKHIPLPFPMLPEKASIAMCVHVIRVCVCVSARLLIPEWLEWLWDILPQVSKGSLITGSSN